MADNFDDVPDSTDWLSTPLSGLSAVEAALRCQVCKDFFKTPMLTSCCHTFCSLCIRRALSNEGKCPLCRASDQELKLRSNWAMEEIVESFTKARKTTLEFARTAGQASARGSSPKRKLVEEDSAPEHQPEAKRLRSSARLSRTRAGQSSTVVELEEEHSPEPREEEEDDEADDATFTPEDGLVPCPICQTRMKQFQVFSHLDKCPGPQPQPSRPSASRTPTPNTPARGAAPQRQTPAPERLPAIAYSMLKDVALRKRMSDLGLSTNGTRQQLEKRHKEWVTLWNANCDSARPKRRAELLHDLDVWERTQGAKAPMFAARPGAAVKDKEFDGAAWAVKHDDSFKDLIANARKSRAQAKQKTEEATAEDATAQKESDAAPPGVVENTERVKSLEMVETAGAEVTMVDLTEPSVDHVATPAHEAAITKPPSSAYYLQDGFSEQIPAVDIGATNSQEAR
ncbi:Postreplication repair E3 ubiquitin-protein ligase rad18 [Colletotrichum aenigma]|uniref:Postreplication repair E3 ubiquitin-protein ligase rad18 n=1 Tax=Colletotrichum aenigma TaxID=1215731 RepID=UPI001872B527|nr:Postreplication repair E3 ubiquitin-protein ligase rad18 [Colletotrichum aenigma]KAF5524770.1 Postreplication repair E3 ubiquitin-protein ligase rad18 [Colletotrichum aenigma]